MSYLVLALKWRPQRFGDVTGQEPVSRTLSNALKQERAAQAYLFSGPRGVGKTSMARILAKALNCVHAPTEEPCNECGPCREITTGRALDVIEIDGASNRGIGDIRELREAVLYSPASLARKVYIIDEVHMLTQDAFNALLKTLEEPPRHVVFILATTEPLKVPATILSRCQRFDFARLGVKDTFGRLRQICDAEAIEAEDDALVLIARRAEGSMRDALTLLDQAVATGIRPLNADKVRATLGLPNREIFFQWGEAIAEKDPARVLLSLASAVDGGANLQELVEEFLNHLRNLLVLATDPSLVDLLETTEEEAKAYQEQARRFSSSDLLRCCRLCLDAAGQMRRSAFPRTHLELILSEMCALPTALDLQKFIEVARGRIGEEGAALPGAPVRAPLPPSRAAGASVRPAGAPGPGGGPSSGPGSGSAFGPAAGSAGAPALGPAAGSAGGSALGPAAGSAGGSAFGPATGPALGSSGVSDAEPAVAGSPSNPQTWQSIVSEVSTKRPALAAYLSGSWVSGEAGNCLHVQIPGLSDFQKDELERKPNRQALLDVVERNFGRPLGLRWIPAASAAPAPAFPAQAATSAPGGSLPAGSAPVRPAAPGGSGTRTSNRAEAPVERIREIADLFGGDVIGPA